MKSFKSGLLSSTIFISLLASFSAIAGEDEVRGKLDEFLPEVEVDSISPSAIDGLYEVVIGPKIIYVSEDGRYLMQGQLIDIDNKRDLTEERLVEARADAINSVSKDEMIEFSPRDPKYHISVFTDIDCGYCRKLHSEIQSYMDAGIAVRYLFYPRAGVNSNSYDKAVSVWCSEDRNAALTRAKNGKSLGKVVCENPIKSHIALANDFGVTGTPMIVTEGGNVLPGYVGANRLLEFLQYEKMEHAVSAN